MSVTKYFALIILLVSWSAARALDASDFSGLEGWTVIAVTNVREEFEGCDFDKRIQLDNGWTLVCSEFSYSYSYRPDVVIFAKKAVLGGHAVTMVKALIDDEFYDMQPIIGR